LCKGAIQSRETEFVYLAVILDAFSRRVVGWALDQTLEAKSLRRCTGIAPVRNPKAPGGAEFVPELIQNRSGVDSDVLAADLNGDGAIDIVTSTTVARHLLGQGESHASTPIGL
jgi:hypothetical protein